jgi:hypothetical protein
MVAREGVVDMRATPPAIRAGASKQRTTQYALL